MKRKRDYDEGDEHDYSLFCKGLQNGHNISCADTSCCVYHDENNYTYSPSPKRRIKRPRINPNYEKVKLHFAPVSYRTVHHSEPVSLEIKKLINNRSIIIEKIVEVTNPVLQEAYESKKAEKAKSGDEVSEVLVFHGTKVENLESICTYNFDWRLFGRNRGHKFGKGVNFSPNVKYASNYSDNSKYSKVMIVARVLISKICEGHNDMSLPPPGYDTSQKGKNAVVIVKYEDNEFYPNYILHYHLCKKGGNNYNRYRYNNYTSPSYYSGRQYDDYYNRYQYNRSSYYDNHYYRGYNNNDYFHDYDCNNFFGDYFNNRYYHNSPNGRHY